MSREAFEYMIRIHIVQVKALLNAACLIVANMSTFLSGDRLNLLSDGCFQCSNGARVTLADVQEENLEQQKT